MTGTDDITILTARHRGEEEDLWPDIADDGGFELVAILCAGQRVLGHHDGYRGSGRGRGVGIMEEGDQQALQPDNHPSYTQGFVLLPAASRAAAARQGGVGETLVLLLLESPKYTLA